MAKCSSNSEVIRYGTSQLEKCDINAKCKARSPWILAFEDDQGIMVDTTGVLLS